MAIKLGGIDLSSSQNPEKLAAWVTGALISFSSLIALFVTKVVGIPVIPEQVVAAASQIGAAVGSLVFLFGLLRKGLMALTTRA